MVEQKQNDCFCAGAHRAQIAHALRRVLSDVAAREHEVRVEACAALGDCTDIPGVVAGLGTLCAELGEPFDVRYAAFMSVERAGPTPAAIDVLTRLSHDETLGRSAQSILRRWQST
jgi:hypothetical protein